MFAVKIYAAVRRFVFVEGEEPALEARPARRVSCHKEAEVEQWRERLPPGSHTAFLNFAASSDPPVAFPAL
jgi:hypothetical protein